jgi:hypothetical protein
MKLFENIAEYHTFKRKYEMMGQLESERLHEVSTNPYALLRFLEFIDEVRSLSMNPKASAYALEEELQADIARQAVLAKYPR